MTEGVEFTLEAEEAINDLLETLQSLKKKVTQHADAGAAHAAAANGFAEARETLAEAAGSLQACAVKTSDVMLALKDVGTPGILSRIDALRTRVSEAATAIDGVHKAVEKSDASRDQEQNVIREALKNLEEQITPLNQMTAALCDGLNEALSAMGKKQEDMLRRAITTLEGRVTTLNKSVGVLPRAVYLTLATAMLTLLASGWLAMKTAGFFK